MNPKTLSRAEYLQTPVGRRDRDYGSYLSYLRRNRPARVAAKADPLRPLSPPEIRRDVTGQVNAQINPVLAEITRSITSRAAAGQGAIRGYTDRLASELGSYQESAGNIYGAAQRAQAAADAALAQRLSGQGGALAEQLSQRFASAGGGGDPGVARQMGEGSSGALYATGSAALSDLISRGAGEQAYAAKLPGLAKLAGIQGARDLQLGAQRDLANETGRVRQQVPGIVSELTRAAQGDELTKTLARLADETKAETAARKAAAAAAAAGRPSSALSNTLGYLVDANGNPLLDANGDAIPTQSVRRQAGSPAKAAKSSRATAIRNRGEAVSSARKTVLALAQKALGTPIKNPNAGKFINGDGIYLDRNGKPTNDPKRAAREGAQSWEDAYRAAYAAIADDLKARYALPEKAIRALIVERLKAAGLKPPQQAGVNLAAAAKPRGG